MRGKLPSGRGATNAALIYSDGQADTGNTIYRPGWSVGGWPSGSKRGGCQSEGCRATIGFPRVGLTCQLREVADGYEWLIGDWRPGVTDLEVPLAFWKWKNNVSPPIVGESFMSWTDGDVDDVTLMFTESHDRTQTRLTALCAPDITGRRLLLSACQGHVQDTVLSYTLVDKMRRWRQSRHVTKLTNVTRRVSVTLQLKIILIPHSRSTPSVSPQDLMSYTRRSIKCTLSAL